MLKKLDLWIRSEPHHMDFLVYIIKYYYRHLGRYKDEIRVLCDGGTSNGDSITYKRFEQARFGDEWIINSNEYNFEGMLLFGIDKIQWKEVLLDIKDKLEEK